MQITLNQDEIEKALKNYVASQGISITGKNVDVTLIAGRAPNGMSACINISNDDVPSNIPTPRNAGQAVEPTVITVTESTVESDPPSEETDEKIAIRPLFGA
jgi:hypothetical protein